MSTYVDKTCAAAFTCNFLSTEKTPLCLENALEPWYEKMEKADAVIKHIPSDSVDHQFLPFVGKFLQFRRTICFLNLTSLDLSEMMKFCKPSFSITFLNCEKN